MIKYSKIILDNGLTVINHCDATSKITTFNLMYNAGSKHEVANKTGLAHYLEHMMFEGTPDVGAFDKVLSRSGGSSNAFTSPDVTNYYQSIPSSCLETAFYLESDRMLNLSLNDEAFQVQKKVVIEEFKQRYLSQPYGDIWHVIRSFCYPNSTYNWPTIGKSTEGIQALQREDLFGFFEKHYAPNNGILVIGGDHTDQEVFNLSQSYFGELGSKVIPNFQFNESKWLKREVLKVEREVPQDMIYMAFQVGGKMKVDFEASSIMADILGYGNSSYLYNKAVLEDHMLSSVAMYHTGGFEDSLLVLSGRIAADKEFEEVEVYLFNLLQVFLQSADLTKSLQRVKNQEIASHAFDMINLQSRVLALAYETLLGDTDNVNLELEKINKVSIQEIIEVYNRYLKTDIYKVIYYKSI